MAIQILLRNIEKEVDSSFKNLKLSRKFIFYQHLHWFLLPITAVIFLVGLNVEFKQKPQPSGAFASSLLSLSPALGEIVKGDTLSVEIKLNTIEPVNALTVKLSYPSDKLEIDWIDYRNSDFSISAEEAYGKGNLEITRGSFEGVSGELRVANIGFKGIGLGETKVSFASGSAVSRSSNSSDSLDLTKSTEGVYRVLSPAPISPKSLSILKLFSATDSISPANEEPNPSESSPSLPSTTNPPLENSSKNSGKSSDQAKESQPFLKLPSLSLPSLSFPEIKLPEINFPSIIFQFFHL